MTQQQPPSDDHAALEPTMELVGGDAPPATATATLLNRVIRGTFYGVVLLAATGLLAVSAVPELARYAPFGNSGSGSSCAARTGSACTTLDKVDFTAECAAIRDAAALSACCPQASSLDAQALTAADTDAAQVGSCCVTISRASLLAASIDKPACCPSSEASAAAEAVAALDEPIDAGSLLATSSELPESELSDE